MECYGANAAGHIPRAARVRWAAHVQCTRHQLQPKTFSAASAQDFHRLLHATCARLALRLALTLLHTPARDLDLIYIFTDSHDIDGMIWGMGMLLIYRMTGFVGMTMVFFLLKRLATIAQAVKAPLETYTANGCMIGALLRGRTLCLLVRRPPPLYAQIGTMAFAWRPTGRTLRGASPVPDISDLTSGAIPVR